MNGCFLVVKNLVVMQGKYTIVPWIRNGIYKQQPTSLQPEPFFFQQKGAARVNLTIKSLALAESEHPLLNPMAVMSCSGRKQKSHTFFYCCVSYTPRDIQRCSMYVYSIYIYMDSLPT